MHNDILCAMMTQALNKKQTKQETPQNHRGQFREGVGSNTAQCRNQGSPPQDPRDHKEQPSRHDFHPDTLKQTLTKPGRNESGEKNYRSETGE